MSDYTNAPATKMLATHCVCCGRPLVDAVSVEMGIGPECRKNRDVVDAVDDDTRKAANEHIYHAAIAAQQGHVGEVMVRAEAIRSLGLGELAGKVGRRFKNAAKKADIIIEVVDGMLRVKTPYRRKDSDGFVQAWRNIPGRRFKHGANWIPVAQKKALFGLLRDFFGGRFAKGPKGVFRIPEPEPKPKQLELMDA